MTGLLPPGTEYAGFTDRTAAFIIDTIIICTLFFYLLEGAVYAGTFIGPVFFAGAAAAFDEPEMPVILGSAVAGAVLFIILCWLYSAGVTSSQYGGTFGKMIMGLKVVDTLGERISLGRATVRFIARIFSGLILGIGLLMIHFSPEKQGLHDRFSGTYVLYAKKTAPVLPEAGPASPAVPDAGQDRKDAESRQNIKKALVWILAIMAVIIALVLGAALCAAVIFNMAGDVSPTYIVAATVEQPDPTTLIVTYQGGADAKGLSALEVVVNNGDPFIWDSPSVGEKKIFHEGSSGPDHVVVTGTFNTGSSQVILDTIL